MKPLSDCALYTFVDTTFLHGRSPAAIAQELCDGGSDIIQLRAKEASPEEVQRTAEALLPVTTRAKVWLVVNDHPAIAAAVGAPLVHLGQEDFFDAGFIRASDVFALEPPSDQASSSHPKLGLSTHSPDQAARAIAAGADYIAIGPVFATGTKPAAKPVTLEYVRWAAAQVGIPWFAIGGISLANLDSVLDAGATRVCVVSAILNAPDIAKACQQFKTRLLSALE